MERDFSRVDCTINIESESVEEGEELRKLKRTIQHGWCTKTRKDVGAIRPADSYDGSIYSIDFGDEPAVSLGGYVDSLLKNGYVVFDYNDSELVVGKLSDSSGDAYAIQGRSGKAFEISEDASNRTVKLERTDEVVDKNRLEELAEVIRGQWPAQSVNAVKTVKSGSSPKSYIIRVRGGAFIEKDSRFPFARHIDTLLECGWGVTGIKGMMLFVAKLKTDGSEYWFESGDEKYCNYCPC